MDGVIPVKAQERKLGRVERRADRNFVGQKFNKAMMQYETALKKEENVQNQAALHLKIARLYFMVRDYNWAIEHYEKAMEQERDLVLVDDVCDYIDALRREFPLPLKRRALFLFQGRCCEILGQRRQQAKW